jgi:3-hydroxyanthranilate 3,4-dioxygenase
MANIAPFNLHEWIAANRHRLQPPVGNACLWNGGFLVMIVGGPNRRSDYHVNTGEELFYQIEGDIVLRLMDDSGPRDVPIRQGELFVLPAGVPHSPQRPANTVGLVVEQPHANPGPHHLRWYCARCRHPVHEVAFVPADIGQQIKAALDQYAADPHLRTCPKCGTVQEP